MYDLDRLAAETVREKASAHASKATLSIEAFGIDRRLEPDWPAIAQARLRYADLEQPSAESNACGFGQYE